MTSIALYGGTFDPIHNGHLILAREAREHLALEKIVFLPARVSPHKLDRPPTDGHLRAEMIAAAIAGEEGFELDTRELHRSGPSYTIDTIREFLAEHPDVRFHYLIGEDSLPDLPKWKEAETIVSLVQFVVLARDTDGSQHDMPVITRRIEISSTEIRHRAANNLSLRYLLPEPVAAIIARHKLYRETEMTM